MYDFPLGFIVEGHCEYESIPSFVGKTLGYFNFPIQNARGIGNILNNLDQELLFLIKSSKPKNIIITLDANDAIDQGLCNTCVELKEIVLEKAYNFLESQQSGSLTLPEKIIVVIADKTFDSWICSDIEGLKSCELIESESITETFTNVDQEIHDPVGWIKSKLKLSVDPKNRRHRKTLASSIFPMRGRNFSPSFNKFLKEVEKSFL